MVNGKGVYGGFMHPRAYLKTPYLEDEWWDAVGVCVEESRKQGFAPWLYDDEYASAAAPQVVPLNMDSKSLPGYCREGTTWQRDSGR